MGKKGAKAPTAAPREAVVFIVIIIVSILTRVPFLKTFQFVTFDGTFYLNQAKALLSGTKMMGAFPVGYPSAVALFDVVVPDIVVAGRVVSFLASVGSAVVLYILAKRLVRREYAFLCALFLALNPLFVRFSLVTMSESFYIFWVLLGLYFFVDKRYIPFGLAMGAAAVTRPEALAIAGILMLTQWAKPRRIAFMLVSFAAVYILNVAVLSHVHGRLVVLSKTQNIGASTRAMELKEATFDFEEKDQLTEIVERRGGQKNLVVEYVHRFPRELLKIVRHILPVIFLLALLGFRKRKAWVFLAALVPFVVYPAATPRSEDRFVLPYIPILILVAFIGLASIRDKRLRSAAGVLVVLSAVALPFVNRATLFVPEHTLFSIRDLGISWSDQINPGEKIADRKPFFAFYAGGEYVEIPLAPYDRTLQYLCDENVKYLFLHRGIIDYFRPGLSPLLYDKAVIAGEMRFRQVYGSSSGEMILERVRKAEPLNWEQVPDYAERNYVPVWSPDGTRLAFRARDEAGNGSICVVSPGQSAATKLMGESTRGDQLSWSPDGRYIAFASSVPGTCDIFALEMETRKVIRLITSEGDDRSPSWSGDGRFIAFTSGRTGQDEIWLRALRSGEEQQLTNDGGNTHPAVSPSGRSIAWVRKDTGVAIMDLQTSDRVHFEVPKEVLHAPAWSPDGKYLAVAGNNWGNWDIYLLTADGSEALVLTKDHAGQGMPSWRPDGRALAINSEHGGQPRNWILTGLEPYLERLAEPIDIRIFDRE
jgi:TolB protein